MDIKIIGTPHIVSVRISSNINSFTAEKKFDKSLTISDLKGRLELITGGSAGSMQISIYNEEEKLVCSIDDDSALLGSFPLEENYRIHVIDSSTKVGEYEDISKVQKFELTEEEYSQKSDSVRSFLKRNRLGKFNEEEQARMQEEKAAADAAEEKKAKEINVGQRCETRVQAEPTRRGEVKFVGKTHFKPGWWIGLVYDEPFGKNDGSVGGKRYFECPMKYGGFVRPVNVTVGDFPELSIDDEPDEM